MEGNILLVLTRQKDQHIDIANGEIVITVIAIGSNYVKIGIQAPPDIPVHRREVTDRIHNAELLKGQMPS